MFDCVTACEVTNAGVWSRLVRLDGSTSIKNRQKLVNRFNSKGANLVKLYSFFLIIFWGWFSFVSIKSRNHVSGWLRRWAVVYTTKLHYYIRTPEDIFVFLLSSKAGGCGLNLYVLSTSPRICPPSFASQCMRLCVFAGLGVTAWSCSTRTGTQLQTSRLPRECGETGKKRNVSFIGKNQNTKLTS